MPAALRLFLALWPDVDTRAALAAEQARWQWPAGARPVRTDGLHLTLHFIGPVEQARVPALIDACRVASAPCTLSLDSAELWPNHCAVLCARDVPPALAALHASIARALRALGLPVERRSFRPHVTLARHAAGAQAPPEATPLPWNARGHVLVQSAGGRYTPLASYD
jgi:2'-5' RNA ligase